MTGQRLRHIDAEVSRQVAERTTLECSRAVGTYIDALHTCAALEGAVTDVGERCWQRYALQVSTAFECAAQVGHLSKVQQLIKCAYLTAQYTVNVGHLGYAAGEVMSLVDKAAHDGIIFERRRYAACVLNDSCLARVFLYK